MIPDRIHVLLLGYSIQFDDACDGYRSVGEGRKILSLHRTRAAADALAAEFNAVVARAEREGTVFPIPEANAVFQRRFGFTLFDIDDGYDFKLIVETLEVNE